MLSAAVRQVYDVVRNNHGLNTNQIAERLKRAASTVENQLTTLKKKGLIEHRGAAKTGGYYPL